MKPFDPTKPAAYRHDPHTHVDVVVLPRPIAGYGRTLLSIDPFGYYRFHFDGGVYYEGTESGYDLVNIPERVEIEAWAVVGLDGVPINYWTNKDYADNCVTHMNGALVVRLTGSYER